MCLFCVMAIMCVCVSTFVLIGASHQCINSLTVYVSGSCLENWSCSAQTSVGSDPSLLYIFFSFLFSFFILWFSSIGHCFAFCKCLQQPAASVFFPLHWSHLSHRDPIETEQIENEKYCVKEKTLCHGYIAIAVLVCAKSINHQQANQDVCICNFRL